jgi:hypothetical protein
MTGLRQVQDFRYLVGAKRIKQMRAALIQLGKEQLRELEAFCTEASY